MRATVSIAALFVLASLAGSCRRTRSGDGPHALRIGLAIPSYVHAVAYVADEQRHFARAGLDTTITIMGGSAATMRGLIAKSIDIGIAGGDAMIKANLAGADLVVVAGLVNRFYHRLVARPTIRRPEALRGKKIGLPFVGGPQDMAVRYLLRKWKLGYGHEVKIVSLGKEFNRLAALSRGAIDATMSQTPPSQLERLGLSVLADLPAQKVAFPYAMVIVRRPFLEQSPRRVRAFLSALCGAIVSYKKGTRQLGRDRATHERQRHARRVARTLRPRRPYADRLAAASG